MPRFAAVVVPMRRVFPRTCPGATLHGNVDRVVGVAVDVRLGANCAT